MTTTELELNMKDINLFVGRQQQTAQRIRKEEGLQLKWHIRQITDNGAVMTQVARNILH